MPPHPTPPISTPPISTPPISTPPISTPPITPEYRQFVLDHAPRFAAAVDGARRNDGTAATNLGTFYDNPFLLYAALWYAASEGVAVTFNPPHRH